MIQDVYAVALHLLLLHKLPPRRTQMIETPDVHATTTATTTTTTAAIPCIQTST